jgi:L-fuconolactonase
VWALRRGDYGWLTPDLAPIYRDFSLADLAPLRSGAGVAATVLVQAAPTVAESQYLLDLATRSEGVVQGVVGWVDLAAPDAIPTLSRLARNPLLKAVRPMVQDLPDPAWLLRTDVGNTLTALPRLGLRFEALVRAHQLPVLLQMFERHPDLAVVVDHAAKPDIAGRAWEPWAGHIRAVAANPRARCKWSGLLTQAGPGWTIDQLRPYTDHLLDCFGPQRLLWGSDWPVVNLAGTYQAWYAATVALTSDWAPDDKAALMGGTARRFYGL